jgi:inner membrane protein
MPSPVGHSLMGLIIYRATGRSMSLQYWQPMALYVLAANAADLDFLPGLLIGDLARFHHGPSHSISFAILFGVVSSLLFSRRLYAFLLSSGLYLSHVLLDYLVQDPSPPLGVPLFWPFSNEYYMASFAFFPRFDYAAMTLPGFLSATFTFHNLVTVSTEILFLLPLLIFVSLCEKSAPG